MNITFFLGNGFDINLGLHTKYKDFYPFFLENAKNDNIIKRWISSDNIELWSDLEISLGEHTGLLKKEQLDKFYEDKDELDRLLVSYLKKQQEKLKDDKNNLLNNIGGEFLRSIKEFDKRIPIEFSQKIDAIKRKYKNEQFCYQFITLNYTLVLEMLGDVLHGNVISEHSTSNGTSKKDIIDKIMHIHGSVHSDMILAVNDESQIANTSLHNDYYFKSSMIKSLLNKGNGHNRMDMAYNIIDGSHIIIMYGVSFGETDNLWWKYIIKWLSNHSDNTLIIYKYLDDRDDLSILSAKKNREMIKTKNDFLKKSDEMNEKLMETLSRQIIVIFEPNIFLYDK